ncbi:MAG: ATP-binding cassette domain-containing protein [Solirubrobacteraceae bacterium]
MAASSVAPLLGLLGGYVQGVISLDVTRRLGLAVTEKCLELSVSDLEDATIRDKYEFSAHQGAPHLFGSFADGLASLTTLTSLVALSGVMFTWNARVALLVLAAPVPALAANAVYARIGWSVELERVEERRRVEYFTELATGVKEAPEVRVLGIGPALVERIQALGLGFLSVDRRVLRDRSLAAAGLAVFAVILTGGAYALAIRQSLIARNVGHFAGFASGAAAVQVASQNLLSNIGNLLTHRLYVGSVFDFLDLEPQERNGRVVRQMRTAPRIAVRNVWFTYPDAHAPALRGVSLDVAAGERIGICGPNGSGKSTLIKLILGFYKPDSGVICVDGMPLEGEVLACLRASTAVVFQDYLRLKATVRENVVGGVGDRPGSDDDVARCLRQVGLLERVERLPHGTETVLGREFANGQQLSVGEWQRLAIARALYRKSRCVILDEPTSAVDRQSQQRIIEGMPDLFGERTLIVIAHQISTFAAVDRVVTLEMGQVACERSAAAL